MKKIFLLLSSFAIVSFSSAQFDIYALMDRTDITLREAETIANQHFERVGTDKGTGYKQFQRWLFERKFHTDENGFYISPQTEWNNYLQSTANRPASSNAANWVPLGPSGWNRTSSWNPGTGRLTHLAIHPSNEQIIYVCSPGGGIWKTTNGGTNWAPLVDMNSTWMNVFALTIDPSNQNIIYAGMANSVGIIKSSDAGTSWAPAGAGPSGTVRKILIHPATPNIVFAAASNGIWRSTNGGTNWSQVHSGSKEDIEFKPDDLNIMYASGNDVYRSTDNGVSWTPVGAAQGITNTGRTLVSVSAANPNIVYAVQASGSLFGRMYRSTDAGLNFITTVVGNPGSGTNYFGYETNGTGTSGQATYDMGMDISPVNADDIYIAGIICWRSTNGGTSFTALTAWSYPNSLGYNHADVHGLYWINSTLYSVSDGGIYKSTDNGDNWTDLSTGLGIRQFYRFSNSQTNANVITGGAQDNGSAARQSSGTWVDWLGADGMEGLVSPTNHLNLWGTSQNGSIYRSTNGGNSYSGLPRPSAGQWVTPIWIHPANETILYGGWTGVYKSTNSGSSWTDISGGIITTTLSDIAVAQSDPNYIYASTGSTLYVTTNDGASWTTRIAPATINDICIDPQTPTKIWIACNSTTNRVMVSTDAGATFTTVSSNLPSIVARTVVVDDNTPRTIYVGMNIGVFYKLEPDANWTNYSDNLPLVAINELEIQKATGKIRVATYGRSIWESPLVSACTSIIPVANFSANNVNICVGQNVLFTNTSTDCQSTYAWTFPGGTPGTSTATNPIITYNTPGVYSVTLTVTTPGGADTKTINNYITVNSNLIHSAAISSPNADICQGQSATFTLNAANQGSTPVIEWLKNAVVIPGTAGLTTVTLPGLINADIISCRETTSLACATPALINTNSITVTVSPNLVHTASISTPKTQLCTGETAQFTLTNNSQGNNPVINWYRNGIIIPGTTGLLSITVANPANGDIITCIETSNAKCVSPVTITSNSITLTVIPTPGKPVISQNVGDLSSSSVAGNQWLLNGIAIPGATNLQYRPTKNGVYQVQVTVNGCKSQLSDPVSVNIEGINKLYPVPTNGQVTFDFYIPEGMSKYRVELYNGIGQLIHHEDGAGQPGLNRLTYNWERLAAGIYTFRMQLGAISYKKQLLVQ
ncbi:MAG TPA: PKD domain-containing protein [Chitinophagaceae bacterium]|nr:PKD domain-containing protein [Chitinophagaceae bacterium]